MINPYLLPLTYQVLFSSFISRLITRSNYQAPKYYVISARPGPCSLYVVGGLIICERSDFCSSAQFTPDFLSNNSHFIISFCPLSFAEFTLKTLFVILAVVLLHSIDFFICLFLLPCFCFKTGQESEIFRTPIATKVKS